MKTLIFLSLFISFSSWAGWAGKAKTFLPAKVQAVRIGETDRESARKALGKPDLVRGDKEYWIMNGFKYALELTYSANKVTSIHYNFPEKQHSLEALKNDINPKLLKASTVSPHTNKVYEDKEGKLEVEISTGKIESVRFR